MQRADAVCAVCVQHVQCVPCMLADSCPAAEDRLRPPCVQIQKQKNLKIFFFSPRFFFAAFRFPRISFDFPVFRLRAQSPAEMPVFTCIYLYLPVLPVFTFGEILPLAKFRFFSNRLRSSIYIAKSRHLHSKIKAFT